MNLEEFGKNLKKVQGTHKIPIEKLMDNKFMKQNSIFSSFNEMLEKSNLEEKYDNFDELASSDEWNDYIKNKTKFESWENMKGEAGKIYTLKKLGF